jgi:hypothetical protein
MRARIAAVALAVAFACTLAGTGCKSKEAGLYVTVTGTVFDIATLHVVVTAQNSGRVELTDFTPPQGQTTIALPVTFTLLLQATRAHARDGALSGPFEVCVTPRDAAGGTLRNDVCAVENVAPDTVTEFVIDFGPIEGDAGSDAGPVCGNGVAEGTEACDGTDLSGADCTTLGLAGGTLGCQATCAYDATGCTGPPTVPVLRKPMNGSYLGSVHAPGSLRPIFTWEPSTVGGTTAITYDLQYSTDAAFGAPVTTGAMSAFPNFTPTADLPVSLTAPVGARYYWRVRACAGAVCSAYSAVWNVNVGRSLHDFNGDGFADVAAGGSESDVGGSNAGVVYVFLGANGTGPIDVPGTTLVGEALEDRFGGAVAAAGDLNADGFGDLLVGSVFNDAGGDTAGRVYVYFGGPGGTLEATPDGVLTGTTDGQGLGGSVASAGDVDGDQYCDVIIGAPSGVSIGLGPGSAHVYLGGPGATFDETEDTLLSGVTDQDQFGNAVAGGIDGNGDGYADVLVGARMCDLAGSAAGCAYLYLGGPTGIVAGPADAVFSGTSAGQQFGYAVASAGDVNGDGFGDVLVGAPDDASAGVGAGRSYLFLGAVGATFDSGADAFLSGLATNVGAGVSLTGGVDLNGDGWGDIAVGTRDAGLVYVFFGGSAPSFDATPDGTLSGVATDEFGETVAGAGDLDGDGIDDLLVAARENSAAAILAGAVYFYTGGAGTGFDVAVDGTLTGSLGDQMGTAVSGGW